MALLESVFVAVVGRVLVPAADSVFKKVGRAAPKWLRSARQLVRRTQLRSQVTEDQLLILRSINGKQMSYEHVQSTMRNRLEGDKLLHALTDLQALGLINRSRLAHPPNPSALLTVSSDAALLLESPARRGKKPKVRRKDVDDAVVRRQRLAEDRQWLDSHQARTRRADYIPVGPGTEAKRRRAQVDDDELWLDQHGFGRDL